MAQPAIGAEMDNLRMLSGYLAPQSIPNSADPMTLAQSANPGVIYATLKVSVQPATDVALPATQKSGSSGGSQSDDSPADSTTRKAATKKKSG